MKFLVLFLLVCWFISGFVTFVENGGFSQSKPFKYFQNARNHLEKLAMAPHPIGSVEYSNVQNYLLQQFNSIASECPKSRVIVEEQHQTYQLTAHAKSANHLLDATFDNLTNILAILPSISPLSKGECLVIDTHYDSAVGSPGASDNGYSVASSLELLNQLSCSKQENIRKEWPLDIIFLMSDGEEHGLLGSKLFVEQNPRAKMCKYVIVFDACGAATGLPIPLRISDNQLLLQELTSHLSQPRLSGLVQDAFGSGFFGGNTNFFIYSNQYNMTGLDMVFLGPSHHYHTDRDTIDFVTDEALEVTSQTLFELIDTIQTVSKQTNENQKSGSAFDVLRLFTFTISPTFSTILSTIAITISIPTLFSSGISFLKNFFVYLLSSFVGIGCSILLSFVLQLIGFGCLWNAEGVNALSLYSLPFLFGFRFIWSVLFGRKRSIISGIHFSLVIWTIISSLCLYFHAKSSFIVSTTTILLAISFAFRDKFSFDSYSLRLIALLSQIFLLIFVHGFALFPTALSVLGIRVTPIVDVAISGITALYTLLILGPLLQEIIPKSQNRVKQPWFFISIILLSGFIIVSMYFTTFSDTRPLRATLMHTINITESNNNIPFETLSLTVGKTYKSRLSNLMKEFNLEWNASFKSLPTVSHLDPMAKESGAFIKVLETQTSLSKELLSTLKTNIRCESNGNVSISIIAPGANVIRLWQKEQSRDITIIKTHQSGTWEFEHWNTTVNLNEFSSISVYYLKESIELNEIRTKLPSWITRNLTSTVVHFPQIHCP